MVTNPKCNDCGSEMEVGIIVGPFSIGVNWHRGVPKLAKLFGLKTSAYMIDTTQIMKTKTYRCTKCGLLKSYANGNDTGT